MKSTAMMAVLGLTLAGAAALAIAPASGAAVRAAQVDETRVQLATETRLREVFQGLLQAERAHPNGAPRASR